MAFKPFEKSKSDKDTKAVLKKFGKEGSPREEAFDKKQLKTGGGIALKNGGKVKKN